MSDRDQTSAFLNRLSYQTDRRIDQLTSDLSQIVRASIEEHAIPRADGSKALSIVALHQVMRDVDRAIAAIYGSAPSVSTPMYQAIAEAGRIATREVAQQSIDDIAAKLDQDSDLLKALGG